MELSGIEGYQASGRPEAAVTAAVLAPVLDRGGETRLLFTKRAEALGDHPGQMSFPGGRREDHDADLETTALREANEEIGLTASETTVVGRLDDIETVTEYVVRPFVGRIPDRTYTPAETEVAEIVSLPVAALIDPTNYESAYRDHPEYGRIRVHYFHVDGYTVWGATGRMLVQLLELTTEWNCPKTVE